LQRKLGSLPFETAFSVRKIISESTSTTYEVLCSTRFTGRDNLGNGKDGSTRAAGNKTVIDKIVLAEGTIGHEEIITAALTAARDNFRAIKQDRVFHVGNLSAFVA
jgi:hypothetical protein